MLKSVKKVEVESITLSGNDALQLKNLCEIMDRVAQTIIDNEPDMTARVQSVVTFCRSVKREFE